MKTIKICTLAAVTILALGLAAPQARAGGVSATEISFDMTIAKKRPKPVIVVCDFPLPVVRP